MANIITAPESGIYFDGNTAGVSSIPTLTGDASGVAMDMRVLKSIALLLESIILIGSALKGQMDVCLG